MENILQRLQINSKILKFFYYLAKINGLAPFSYTINNDNQNIQILSSHHIVIYSICANCVLVITLLITLIVTAMDIPNFFQQKFLFILMFCFENLNFIIKCLINCCIPIINRKQLISLINEHISLWNMMEKLSSNNKFFNKIFMPELYLQIFFVIFQLLSLLLPSIAIFYINNIKCSTAIFWSWIFIIYIHGISSIIVNSTFYFGCMLMHLYFYRIINMEIQKFDMLLMMKINRMQNQCNICDRIDDLAMIYLHATECCRKVQQFFQIQLVNNLIGAFCVITIEVNFIVSHFINFC